MSSIVVAGDTSGSVTLQAPAVAGSTVLTLPAVSGTVGLVSGDLGTPSALVGTNISGTSNSLNAGLGVNQTWQYVGASRAVGTTYTNSTGKPIQVSIYKYFPSPSTSTDLYLTVSGIAISYQSCFSTVGGNWGLCVTAIVPNGTTYSVASSGVAATIIWNELR